VKLLGKRILFILTGFIAGASIGILIYYTLLGHYPGPKFGLVLVSGSGLFGDLLLWLFYGISQWLNKRLALEKQFSLRITLDFILNATLAIFISGTVHFSIINAISPDFVESIWETYKESFLMLWIMMVVLVLMYNIIMLVFYAYHHYAEGQIADVKMERKQLRLQYEALRNQLSPHFLFNSLNTISSLIHQDEDRAEEFIRRLANTYQYVLGTHNQQLISLEKELEFVNAYYFLLCVRFNEGLDLKINIPHNLLTHKVPPLSLQILLENAIKHNVFSKDEPLVINLSALGDKELKMVNNKTKSPQVVKSNNVGLKNVQKRYSYFTENKVTVKDENDFEVRIPIIKNLPITSAA
jgi:two-component system, LytTR family, sensor kinase